MCSARDIDGSAKENILRKRFITSQLCTFTPVKGIKNLTNTVEYWKSSPSRTVDVLFTGGNRSRYTQESESLLNQ